MVEFPVAERPGQYVAFCSIQINTKEGLGFIFLAVDAFSAFAYYLDIEKDESPESVLKNIYLLTENPDFLLHRDNGFTLVLEKYEELDERIKTIIHALDGKLMHNKKYNNYISNPVLKSILDLLIKLK